MAQEAEARGCDVTGGISSPTSGGCRAFRVSDDASDTADRVDLTAQLHDKTGEMQFRRGAGRRRRPIVLACPHGGLQTSMPIRSIPGVTEARTVLGGKPFGCARSRAVTTASISGSRGSSPRRTAAASSQTPTSWSQAARSSRCCRGSGTCGAASRRTDRWGCSFRPNLKPDFEEQARKLIDHVLIGRSARATALGGLARDPGRACPSAITNLRSTPRRPRRSQHRRQHQEREHRSPSAGAWRPPSGRSSSARRRRGQTRRTESTGTETRRSSRRRHTESPGSSAEVWTPDVLIVVAASAASTSRLGAPTPSARPVTSAVTTRMRPSRSSSLAVRSLDCPPIVGGLRRTRPASQTNAPATTAASAAWTPG